MDLRSYCRLLIRRWRVLLLVFILVGALLAGAGFLIPTSYTANIRLVLVPNISPYSTIEARQGAQSYIAERMKTYAQVVTTTQVLQPVIDTVGLGVRVPDLVKDIEVTIPPDTLVIDISVSAPTAAKAASAASRIADQMSHAVANLEGAPSVSDSPVYVKVLQPADIPLHRSSPNVVLNLIVATLVALIAAVFAAVFVHNFEKPLSEDEEVAAGGDGRNGEGASGR
ncbi:capsular polysaccharide biosynthesis protein [Mycolicibacterium rhodesiae NBB3]|uniref:Capsular polysaccharide biosynthesis protein n=1 Tax=Mycolicibacterium rhodesiae (strain NBB3) TaxID=710685 RepID=G8RX44_MYCRN|nr:Wzz/FepE/Etk N-terminal domain-containing protein [Mycolicibacterium rhodesiae]AEV71901.1 capsular polysaccharide biosynthesis protein [Mycolicibacterium rhodesiae NBB3]